MTHPYPKHVVEAVAKALMKSSEGRDAFGAGGDWDAAGFLIKQEFLEHAETALRTLWDASRVAIDEIGELPHDAAFIDGYGFIASSVSHAESNPMENPVHVIYWGDAE